MYTIVEISNSIVVISTKDGPISLFFIMPTKDIITNTGVNLRHVMMPLKGANFTSAPHSGPA
ncbi:hypothetical protein GCM10023188_34730 [Pontibacter saemangeumensis]|uniref:Uncharacterized protein n=1 Tax=Pontibacter saemangeumensis TaxID=1084525 RepID=A0ABP8LWP4_9BACT